MTMTTRPDGLIPGQPTVLVRDGVSVRITPSNAYLPFWQRVASGTWEPNTLAVLRRFLDRDETMLDIGAWIGPTTLFGAHYAREVIAFEPDPVAFNELAGNIALNPDIKSRVGIVPACVAPSTGPVELYCGGFHHTHLSDFGDSMTSLLPCPVADEQAKLTVQGVSIELIDSHFDFRHLGFIKMDIEGGEYLLLPTMREFLIRYRPTLFVSFHVPPSVYRDRLITKSFDTLAELYPRIYAANGREVPLKGVLELANDWDLRSPHDPATMLMAVARNGLVATFEEW